MEITVHTVVKFSMDGVFMFKLWKKVGFLVLAFALAWCVGVIRDRAELGDKLIRLHVVANSDSETDQAVKLQVRDAVMDYLKNVDLQDVRSAKAYLQENLPEIRQIANRTLKEAGHTATAAVSLCKEAFDVRHYDNFSLPAGVYEALRITIGEGKGRNWWCVVFPALCYSAAGETFEDVAVGAGFSGELASSLEGKDPIEIRFFLLDWLGKLENMLFDGGN